jgi:hypothetical protein
VIVLGFLGALGSQLPYQKGSCKDLEVLSSFPGAHVILNHASWSIEGLSRGPEEV